MADRFDVEARLAEGRPAVEHTQTYVQACHSLGYQHPDLTAHASQVHDWYEAEAGLDLRRLDDDSAELRAAGNTIDEALWRQRMQVTEIAAAWSGFGADSATQFLQRHCDIAAELAAHVRAAAEGYAVLRDNLWRLVDGKAATVVDIDERSAGERSAWLAAAHTVNAGAGERSAAEELIHQRIIPYVDNDIRGDWLAAMRSTAASVESSYDSAIEALSSVREARFEIPGELGPRRQQVFDDLPPAAVSGIPSPADIAPTVPAAVSAPVPSPPAPLPQPPTTPADLAAPLGDPAGLSTGAGDLGSLGGLAGSIGGVVGKIVDGIGDLVGSLADGFSDPSGSDDSPLDDAPDVDDPVDDAANDDDVHDEAADAKPAETDATDEDATAEAPAENPPAAGDSVAEPADQPVTPPPDVPPPAVPAPAEAPPEGSTPCEIAADELPQAGQ